MAQKKKKKKRSEFSQLPRKSAPPAISLGMAGSGMDVSIQPVEENISENSLANVKTLFQNGRRDQALGMMQNLPANVAEDIPLLQDLGHFLMSNQDFDSASAVYRRWIALDPENPTPHNSLGAALVSAGWSDAAIPPMQRAASLRPDIFVYGFNLAKAYMVGSKWEEAKAVLLNMQQRFPDQKNKIDQVWAEFPDDVEISFI